MLRGRVDTVLVDLDGYITVVDWKTGESPRGPEAMRQVAAYCLAWTVLCGRPESSVRAVFVQLATCLAESQSSPTSCLKLPIWRGCWVSCTADV
ncbi:PD-(D/E)XK nuclease family protein [Mycobacterium lepromatosis]|uniref:PD-(D/E)XK nuclease family protein n=1 Tax=Mycobacterium lepromatosis TaxID=480418 RepID=UPI002351E279|nr:PD-(D/E)XK nuclease family protein [Mycobacterium lepromatosis]